MRRNRWTRAAVLEALRAAGRETGRWWTLEAWMTAGRTPSVTTVLSYWGTWCAAWAEAGYPPPDRWAQRRIVKRDTWTRNRVAAALQQAAAEGQRMTLTAWRRARRQPTAATILRRFGSWKQALAAAGLTVPQADRRADWQAAYDRLRAQLGRRPRPLDWNAWPERPVSARRAWAVCGWPPGQRPQAAFWAAVPIDQIPDPRIRAWVQRYRDGETLAAIASSAGITREAVRIALLHAKRRWIMCRSPALAQWARRAASIASTPAQKTILRQLAAGASVEDAAQAAGLDAARVRRWVWNNAARSQKLSPLGSPPSRRDRQRERARHILGSPAAPALTPSARHALALVAVSGSYSEAARQAGVSPADISRWMRTGTFPSSPLALLHAVRRLAADGQWNADALALPWSTRVRKRLARAGVRTMRDLLVVHLDRLEAFPGWGAQCTREVNAARDQWIGVLAPAAPEPARV